MKKTIFSILIAGITASQLWAQETTSSEGTGFDFSPALIVYQDAYQNPVLKFNIKKNRLGAGFIFSGLNYPQEKVIGANLLFDRVIFFNNHFDFYFEADPAYFQKSFPKNGYYSNSDEPIMKYNRLDLSIMCGFRYFPFKKWFFLAFDAGMAYNVWEQAPDEDIRMFLPKRIGMGWLLYKRKY
jgi:hypothetical protein